MDPPLELSVSLNPVGVPWDGASLSDNISLWDGTASLIWNKENKFLRAEFLPTEIAVVTLVTNIGALFAATSIELNSSKIEINEGY